jgi:hypothetical protein
MIQIVLGIFFIDCLKVNYFIWFTASPRQSHLNLIDKRQIPEFLRKYVKVDRHEHNSMFAITRFYYWMGFTGIRNGAKFIVQEGSIVTRKYGRVFFLM